MPKADARDDILRLYEEYPYKPLIKSLIARKQASVITGDNGAMITWGPSVMVGGECSALILDKLGSRLKDSQGDRFLYLPSGDWISRMDRAVSSQLEVKQINVYAFHATDDEGVREDESIVPVTANLLESGLRNARGIVDELYSYLSLEDFYQTGFGLALVKNHAVCGYCLSEYSMDAECGVNIWVDEKYRGRGYAKAMTQRFLAHAQNEHWKVFWACFADNAASNHVALSCGFEPFASQPCWVWRKA